MRRLGIFAALASSSLIGVAPIAPAHLERAVLATSAIAPRPNRKRRFASVGGSPGYRSKRRPARRLRRSNRLHISRRVRRRHRRAA